MVKKIKHQDSLQDFATRRQRIVREREILRVASTIGGKDGKRTAEEARTEILKWVEKRTGGELPPSAWEHDGFEHLAGGRNCTAVRIVDSGKDIWAIRADDPDKSIAQRVWTTEVIVGRKRGRGDFTGALFSLRLLVSSPEQELQIEPAVPYLVHQLASKCGLHLGSGQVHAGPWTVNSDEAADQLIEMLVDQSRRVPVFVLTVPEHSDDPTKPLIDPAPIARATLGMAIVVVLPAQFTWVLTERFGKRLSVYNGAVRIYLPGFAEGANPYGGHELFLGDRLTIPENASRVSTLLRQAAAKESLRRLRLGQDVLSFASVREQSFDLERARLQREGATETEQLSAAHAQIATLKADIRKIEEEQQWFWDEHKVVEERAKNAESKLNAASYRIQQLLNQLKAQGEDPDANIPLPTSWGEFADWCDKNLVGRVLLSARAQREIKTSQFGDVGTAARCLLWLANDYRERRLSGGNGNLRISLESGILNDRCGSNSFQMDWQGKRVDVEWHIKNGGNTRDPSRCLRIYYFWDDSSQQVIVASMPGHIKSGAT